MSRPEIMFHDALQHVFGRLDWLPLADGDIHRFHVPGDKPGTQNGWYLLFLDNIPSGAFGSWKAGSSQTWSSRKPVNRLEANLNSQRIAQARQQQKANLARRQMAAADRANRIWNRAQPAHADHPYLLRKGCQPHSLREHYDTLLVPLCIGDQLVNLQYIHPHGGKRFLPGGRVKGCYSLIGLPAPGQTLYVCEGWATGATLHESTGLPVACAMNASNLLEAGRQLQETYRGTRLIIAGDDDRQTDENPGRRAANHAAAQLGCNVVFPCWDGTEPLSLTDFNDLARWRQVNA